MPQPTVLDLFKLTGRRALVTGGGKGLGKVIARALAEAGADVVVSSRTGSQLAEVVAQVEATGRRAVA
ncbi:MAG TPA: SDR family NAD(P)-dependent oxidoreductase, partial [Tepidisphaeraceae bacterium]|nr:SDR family NAD(P)-dependent oxidoreductase [Tepidisphaeraceae bacterium]